MLERLKGIILDFQEQKNDTGIPRRLDVTPVPNKATICIGARRSGKSTYLFQLIQKLLDSGVSQKNILYINFFDDRLHELRADNLGTILEAYFALFPEKKNTEKIYLFFDEIQVIPGWESFTDRVMRTENCQVYITGSSAQMLSREIATQMRGRAISWEVFPFSFAECLDYQEIWHGSDLSTKQRLLIQKGYEKYFETGGFPEVLGLHSSLRIKIHQEYFNAMLFRDIIERYDISHPKAVKDLALKLIDNTGSLYTINKLTQYLKSLGYNVPKSSVSDYLNWFEDAYILFTVRMFDASMARANVNPKKIYCIDHAMVSSLSSGILLNSGHLLENLVFTTLRRYSPKVFYYRTNGGREVDFLCLSQNRTKTLFQVSESLADQKTKTREVTALNEAMAELGLHEGTIVTRNEEDSFAVEAGMIRVVPAWRFILNWVNY